MAEARHAAIRSISVSPLIQIVLPLDFAVQPFLFLLLTEDLPALRCVCAELRRGVDAHDLETQKVQVRSYLEEVCAHSGAVYSIFWSLKKGSGTLHAMSHYNPEERIEHVRSTTGEDALYSTESYGCCFRPGEGLIGKAFSDRSKRFFFQDVQELPESIFIRRHVAERFGIKSVAVLWYRGGVLEFGTTDEWTSFNWATTVV
jgi:hypothetical protein